MIGHILLGDVEAESSFELTLQSRVMLGVIKCCCAPAGVEKDENLFSVVLQDGDLKGRTLSQCTQMLTFALKIVTENRPNTLAVQLESSFVQYVV